MKKKTLISVEAPIAVRTGRVAALTGTMVALSMAIGAILTFLAIK